MKRIIILCIVIVFTLMLTLLAVGCQHQSEDATSPSQQASSPPSTPETKTYSNSEYGFSCEYPDNWDVEEGLAGMLVMFAGPLVGEYDYLVNINLVSEELPRKISIEDYGRMGELQIKKSFPDYVNLQEKTTTISGIPAIVRTFTATIQDFPLKDTQAYFIKDQVAYIITFDVTLDSHDEYADCFNLVINSFIFE